MVRRRYDLTEPRTKIALKLLKEKIKRRYTDAEFSISEGDDPDGIYLYVVRDVDEEELDRFFEDQEFLDLMYEVQGEQRLPIYVFPRQPLERMRAEAAKQLALHDSVPTSP